MALLTITGKVFAQLVATAAKPEINFYHEYFDPSEMPLSQLRKELAEASEAAQFAVEAEDGLYEDNSAETWRVIEQALSLAIMVRTSFAPLSEGLLEALYSVGELQ